MLKKTDRLLLLAARDLVEVLENMGLTPTIIGGVAISLLTRSRHTDDVDVVIDFDIENASILIENLAKNGFKPRFSGMEDLARQARMITLLHEATGTVIDIALGCMPFETEVQDRAQLHKAGGVELRLPTPEDMVILKALASRPKDLEDIRNLGLTYPNMDRARIEYWLISYGELMETPDLWEATRSLLDGSA